MPKYRVLQVCYFNDAIRQPGDEIEVGTDVFDPKQTSTVIELMEPMADPAVKKTAKAVEA